MISQREIYEIEENIIASNCGMIECINCGRDFVPKRNGASRCFDCRTATNKEVEI